MPQARRRDFAAAFFAARAAHVASMHAASTYAAATSRYTCRLGHTGNGDSMLAYHLMDFSRYFFDQSNIRH